MDAKQGCFWILGLSSPDSIALPGKEAVLLFDRQLIASSSVFLPLPKRQSCASLCPWMLFQAAVPKATSGVIWDVIHHFSVLLPCATCPPHPHHFPQAQQAAQASGTIPRHLLAHPVGCGWPLAAVG